MPADIIDPLTGDTVTIALGGNVTLTVTYQYTVPTVLTCFVDTDADPAFNAPGRTGTHTGVVPITKGVGSWPVAATAKSDGTLDDTETFSLVVTGSPVVKPVSEQMTPAPPARAPAAGTGPVEYRVRGKLRPGGAYLVVVAIEIPIGGARKPLIGVNAMADALGDWIVGGLVVPNNANCAYVARVMTIDATDNIIHKETVVLLAPPP